MTRQLTTDEITKIATMRIRKIARRGTNAKLEELVKQVFVSGIEHGMRQLSEQLKERLHDNQITNNGNHTDRVGGESDSTVTDGGSGPDTDDADSNSGSTESV